MEKGGVQLPDDVVSKGYCKVGRFEFKQVFYSPSLNFEGSEEDFIKAGYAYRFIQLDANRRAVI